MEENKYILGIFIGFIVASFHLVFKSTISENISMVGLGVVFTSGVYLIACIWNKK